MTPIGNIRLWPSLLSQQAEVAGLIPRQGTHKRQPMSAQTSGPTTYQWVSVSLPLSKSILFLKKCPGHIAQLVRASSRYTKVAGSIPGQGTYKNQPMSA